ncbi:Beta-porphyranase B precursor [Planctomycetes bacterium MalM25]|nr:Beta-porphyranase B precursor [Planctomycetes bacterium MalM25]
MLRPLLALLACGLLSPLTLGEEVSGPFFAEGHDPLPEGKRWTPVAAMSDEFDGDEIDHDKWQSEPIGNGWGWIGRPPGLFRSENVRVADGKMNVTVSPLPEPQTIRGEEYRYQGAIVRSHAAGKPGMYFETRMKANATAMSSTFWLMTKGHGAQRQELDIQECVGATSELTDKWARKWNQIFHSNLILTGRSVPEKVQIQKQLTPPTPNHERFYVYAGWWKSPHEVQFFFDGEYAYSLKPTVDWDLPKYLQMAIETYDWNPVPEGGELIATGTWEQRTTQYDWIRVWELE